MSTINLTTIVAEPDFSKMKCPWKEDCDDLDLYLCQGEYTACDKYKLKIREVEERR